MPYRQKKACGISDCPTLINIGEKYCKEHMYKKKGGGGNLDKGLYYSARWKRLRIMILRRDPICKDCSSQASTTVDHIIPVSQGGTDDMDNLQGLCEKCHNRKSAKEKKDFIYR